MVKDKTNGNSRLMSRAVDDTLSAVSAIGVALEAVNSDSKNLIDQLVTNVNELNDLYSSLGSLSDVKTVDNSEQVVRNVISNINAVVAELTMVKPAPSVAPTVTLVVGELERLRTQFVNSANVIGQTVSSVDNVATKISSTTSKISDSLKFTVPNDVDVHQSTVINDGRSDVPNEGMVSADVAAYVDAVNDVGALVRDGFNVYSSPEVVNGVVNVNNGVRLVMSKLEELRGATTVTKASEASVGASNETMRMITDLLGLEEMVGDNEADVTEVVTKLVNASAKAVEAQKIIANAASSSNVALDDVVADLNSAAVGFAGFVPNVFKQQSDIIASLTEARVNRLNQRLGAAGHSSDGVDYDDTAVTSGLVYGAFHYATSISTHTSDNIDDLMFGDNADDQAVGNFINSNKTLLRRSMFANRKLDGIKDKIGNSHGMSPVIIRTLLDDAVNVVESVADAQLNVLRTVDVRSGAIPKDNARVAKRTLGLVDSLLQSLEHVQRDNPAARSLRAKRSELASAIGNTERMMSAVTDVSGLLKRAKGQFSSALNVIAGGAAIMGLGAIMSTFTNPLGALGKVNDRYEANGVVRANLAMVDGAAGLDVDSTGARELSYDQGKMYHDMTYGSVGFDAVANYYSTLMTNVGGHYGGSQASARADARSFAESTFSTKTVLGLSDGTMNNFYKTFYKDMGLSAGEATDRLARLADTAHASNVPVETYVDTITQLADGLRSAGVNAERVMGAVDALVRGNMRVEDASSIVRSTANAGAKLSSNWGATIFYGAALGKGGSMFGNVLDSMMSHTADGKPIEGYYDSVVDRVFGQTGFMMDVFGGAGSAVGNVAAMDQLTQLGYSQKDASTIISAMRTGGRDAIKDKLKAVDDKNDPLALPTNTKKMNELLKNAGDQHAETRKMLADLDSAINDTAVNLDESLHGPLAGIGRWLSKLITEFEKMAEGVISGIGGFLGSGFGKFVLDGFVNSPFIATGVAVGGSTLAVAGARRLISSGAGALSSATSSMMRSAGGSSGRAKLMTAAAIGLTSLLTASSALAATPDDVLNQTLTDGTAKAQVANWSDFKHVMALFGVAALGVAGVALLKRLPPGKLGRFGKFGNKFRTKFGDRFGKIPRGLRSFGLNALLALADNAGRDDLSRTELAEVVALEGGGMTAGEYVGSRAGGAFGRTVASMFGARGRALAPLAERAGSLVGGVGGQVAGGSAAKWLEKLLGVGGSLAQQATNEGESYEEMARRLGMSNEDFTKLMQLSLSDHGLKANDLNEDQKRYWLKTFNDYMQIYGSVAAAAVAAANNLANSTVNQQEVYDKVDAAWANDDATKGSWFERRAKELDESGDVQKASEYRHIANYYYHSSDDENSEYWASEADNLQALANGDDGDAKRYWTSRYEAWLRHNMASLDGKHSRTLGGATRADVRLFIKWLAEQNSAGERKRYDETVGYEEYQKALKSKSTASIRRGGPLDIMTPHAVDVAKLQAALDARGIKLDANVIVQVCREKNLDPLFLTASICHENGQIGRFNYGNVKGDGTDGYRDYDSQTDGVRGAANTWVAIAREEKSSDFGTIAHVYADDPNYVSAITSIMSEITGESVSSGVSGNFMNVNASGAFTNTLTDAQYGGMTDPTKQFLNVLSERFFKQTGVKVNLTSGYRPDDTGSYHSQGIAFDVTADEFEGENGLDLRHQFTNMAAEMGGTPLDEYPGGEGEQYARGNNIHVSVHNQDGAFTNQAGGSPRGTFTPPKPKTFVEQERAMLGDYNAIMAANGAKTVQGRIVNGMYVDAGQRYESVADVREASASSLRATMDTAASDALNAERGLVNRLTNSVPDEVVQRKSNFDVILAKTEEIAKRYMDNPKIVANCTYADGDKKQ